MARTAASRPVHGVRATVVAATRDDVVEALRALALGRPHPRVVHEPTGPVGKVAFVYSGQGGQWPGMAQDLIATSVDFREAVEACDVHLEPLTGWRAADLLADGSPTAPDDLETAYVVHFVVQHALTALWGGLGLEPDVVAGHSQGEVAAAHAAGALSLESCVRLVVARSRALATVRGTGAMAFAEIGVDEAERRLARFDGRLSVAVVNTPGSVVVAGEADDLDDLLAELDDEDLVCGLLEAPVASHSALVDPAVGQLSADLAEVTTRSRTDVPFVSAATGRPTAATALDLGYWLRSLREPVRFDLVQDRLRADGVTHFVEISTHPGLSMPLTDGGPGTVLTTLSRGHGRREDVLASLARAWVSGLDVAWTELLGAAGPDRVDLPTYRFQRRSFWLETTGRSTAGPVLQARGRVGGAPSAYDQEWEPVAAFAPLEHLRAGTWALVGPDVRGREGIAAVLDELGIDWEACTPGELAALQPAMVIATCGTAGGATTSAAESALEVLGSLDDLSGGTTVWLVTRGGVSTGPTDPADVAQSLLHGLARVAVLEHPAVFGGVVDLDATAEPDWQTVVSHVSGAHGEDELALRSDRVLTRRLRPARHLTSPDTFTTSGTALVTGGRGALGRHLAGWLAARGAERIVLVSRTEVADDGADAVEELAASIAVPVDVRRCDVADPDAVRELVASLDAEGHDLRVVAHLAGVSQPASLADLTPERLRADVAAKATGASALHAAVGDRDLDAFLLFSSGAWCWGGAGQAAYAAANAALEAVASVRRAAGRDATVVHWGGWAGGGMVDEAARALAASRGLHTMSPEACPAAVGSLLTAGVHDAAVAHVDWSVMGEVMQAARPRPLLSRVAVPDRVPAAAADWPPAGTPAEQAGAALDLVVAEVVAVVGDASIGADDPLRLRGFDSLMAVTVRTRLVTRTGAALRTADLVRAGTCRAIAALLVPDAGPADPRAATSRPPQRGTRGCARSLRPTARGRAWSAWPAWGHDRVLQARPLTCATRWGRTWRSSASSSPAARTASTSPRPPTRWWSPTRSRRACGRRQHPGAAGGHSQGAWLAWRSPTVGLADPAHRPCDGRGLLAAAVRAGPAELAALTTGSPGPMVMARSTAAPSTCSGRRSGRRWWPRTSCSTTTLSGSRRRRAGRPSTRTSWPGRRVARSTSGPAVAVTEDPLLPDGSMEVWGDRTTGAFELATIAGTHAAPLDNPAAMAVEVAGALRDLLGGHAHDDGDETDDEPDDDDTRAEARHA